MKRLITLVDFLLANELEARIDKQALNISVIGFHDVYRLVIIDCEAIAVFDIDVVFVEEL